MTWADMTWADMTWADITWADAGAGGLLRLDTGIADDLGPAFGLVFL